MADLILESDLILKSNTGLLDWSGGTRSLNILMLKVN